MNRQDLGLGLLGDLQEAFASSLAILDAAPVAVA
jgi:hypothetical protein